MEQEQELLNVETSKLVDAEIVRSYDSIYQMRMMWEHLEYYKSIPHSNLSKRNKIQFLCKKLHLAERRVYHYLSIYKQNDGDIEKAIADVKKHGSVNKTIKYYERIKLNKKYSSKTIQVRNNEEKILVPQTEEEGLKSRMNIITFYANQLNLNCMNFYEEIKQDPRSAEHEVKEEIQTFIYKMYDEFIEQFNVLAKIRKMSLDKKGE